MNKRRGLSLAICLAFLAGSGFTAPLSPEQALSRYKVLAGSKSKIKVSTQLKLEYTENNTEDVPVAYVYTRNNSKGFLILSADDVMVPLLGYSESDSFNAESVPPAVKWWLSEYGRRLDFLKKNGVKFKESANVYAPESWTSIEPLCKTKWDQGAPYNNECPVVNGVTAPTGCVATSMAQAMKYFNYPERGTGEFKIRIGNKTYDLRLGPKAINWDEMLDTYSPKKYTDSEASAVSYLMKACGFSVDMGYGQYASGAQSYKIVNALRDNFEYDANISYVGREYYSPVQWATMIYDNIKNIGPVIYNGTSIEGGHSFICDGYDGDGYFHFNWGWSGVSDGYYVLDILNPESQGIGGSVGGFNYSQDVVLGMQLPTGLPENPRYGRVSQMGTTVASVKGNNIYFSVKDANPAGWGIASYNDIDVDLLASFENMEDGSIVYGDGGLGNVGTPMSLPMGYYVPIEKSQPVVNIPASLSDGSYKVTLCTRDNKFENAPILPVLVTYGYANYCILNVNNGLYSISNVSPSILDFESVTLNPVIYFEKRNPMNLKVKNDTELDLSVCVQPYLVKDGKNQFAGNMSLVSVLAGNEMEQTWAVVFYQLAGADNFTYGDEFTLVLIDKTTGETIGEFGTYRMESSLGTLKVDVKDFSVPDTKQENVSIDGKNFKNAYIVDDLNDVVINFDYEVTSGYFDSLLTLGMQWYNPVTKTYETVDDRLYSDYPFLARGEKANINLHLNLSDHVSGGVYNVRASYGQTSPVSLGSIFIAPNSSGIDIIDEDKMNQEVEYFNMQGLKITNPMKGQVLIKRTGSKIEKITL